MKNLYLISFVFLILLKIGDCQIISKLFDHTNSPIGNDWLSSLAIDSNQTIWIGSNENVFRYIYGNWHPIEPNIFTDSENSAILIEDIQVSNSGDVWITKSIPDDKIGLYQYSDDSWQMYRTNPTEHFSVLRPNQLFIDHDNVPWFTLKNWWPHNQEGLDEIGKFSDSSLIQINIPRSVYFYESIAKYNDTLFVSGAFARDIHNLGLLKVYNDNWDTLSVDIWNLHFWTDGNQLILGGDKLCTYNGKLNYFDKVNKYLKSEKAIVSSFKRESDSTFWLGTNNGQLLKVLKDSIQIIQELENVPIIDLNIDAYENKWMILLDKGVFVYNENGIVNIDHKDYGQPEDYILFQNHPNPFNSKTKIKFNLPKNTNVKVEIFDLNGKKILTLANQFYLKGSHELKFNGSTMASGIYLYRLTSNNYQIVKKMVLLK